MPSMKLKDIYDIIDAAAPFVLSKEYIQRGMHDNSGLLLDCGKDITGVLFSLDLTPEAVDKATKCGANLIVTHHPAIWDGVMRITEADAPALYGCVKAGISVISAHLNLDAAKGGIDESLMLGLGGKEPIAVMEELSCGGYGRVYDVPPMPLDGFAARARETFDTDKLAVYGEGTVRRVASFCGGGFSFAAIAFALEHGADTLVTSDGKHHIILDAVGKGLNVLHFTHYASENFGFSRFAERIKNKIGLPCTFYTDRRFL